MAQVTDNPTGSSVLVTGGAGYIGSHACKALARAGYTPISFDNLVYGHRWAARWGPLEEGDINDRARLDAVITDLADAHVLALQALERGSASDAFNLGNGQGFSVREVLDHARRITGREIPFTIGPRRPGDPPRLVGDAARAREILGWRPRYADLDAIVETAWVWHQRTVQDER